MGSIALIARELGYDVSGSDENVYPPMSTQLEEQGIKLMDGYSIDHLNPRPDLVLIGNTMTRGNEVTEYILNQKIPYFSGPEWLYKEVLIKKHVLAVAGTHGKTTTTSMLSWILECANLNPGFLIGGVAENFSISARLTDSDYFVIEADEYDTAFFDKRSKFIHYHPSTLVINNIEFDHADIFRDVNAIQIQFHHLIRTISGNSKIIVNAKDKNIQQTINMGCWSNLESFSVEQGLWHIQHSNDDFSCFDVIRDNFTVAKVEWALFGKHNAENALAAIAAAYDVGVNPEDAAAALSKFKSVKRRLEKIAEIDNITLYDDFAHHPSAIELTIDAVKKKTNFARVIVVLEPRSNTMLSGVHSKTLAPALTQADMIFLFKPENLVWDLQEVCQTLGKKCTVYDDIDDIVSSVSHIAQSDDHIVIMSNGGFAGIHKKLANSLRSR